MPWFLIVTGVVGLVLGTVLYVLTVAAGDERPSVWTKFGGLLGFWLVAWLVVHVLCRVLAWFWGLLWLTLS
jgi:hypothetical protein